MFADIIYKIFIYIIGFSIFLAPIAAFFDGFNSNHKTKDRDDDMDVYYDDDGNPIWY